MDLPPYAAPDEGRYGKIRLDFNENTTGFWDALTGLDGEHLTAYPEYGDFTRALAETWGVPTEGVLLTNGSDEALCIIANTFIEPDVDTAMVSRPTFMMIPHYLRLAQAKLVEIPVCPDLAFDTAAITEALSAQPVKLAIFPSPDNPTGAVLAPQQVLDWCQAFPKTLFVIDEAYVEFGAPSILPHLALAPNLLVTRTFSKAWGLAGLRLGVILGAPGLIDMLGRVRSPFSVNAAAVAAVWPLLSRQDAIRQQAITIRERKATVIATLRERGFRVIDGQANFFLLGLGIEATAFCRFAAARDILIRDRSSIPALWGYIRVSVGTEAEMTTLLAALTDFIQSRALFFDLDDTLVDTSLSFDRTVAELVLRHSGKPLEPGELKRLRAEGGFNDDWDSTRELLRRRGVDVSWEALAAEGVVHYLAIAKATETPLFEAATLEALKTRYDLHIITGRARDEYLPVWGDRLPQWFGKIVCQDDVMGARRKPEPDLMHDTLTATGKTGGLYIGNSVDDMRAATAAGLIPIGVTQTHDAETLCAAGAVYTVPSIDVLPEVLML